MNALKSSEPLKLLLIEDNPGDARLIKELFRDEDHAAFDFSHAPNLAEGISRLERDQIEALLLDLSLPDSEGLDTFVRAHQAAPTVPVIVLTGLNDESTAVEAVRLGAQDFIIKGNVDGGLLVRALRYAVERGRREQEFEAIASISSALRVATTRQQMVPVILEQIHHLLRAQSVAVILTDVVTKVHSVERATGLWQSASGQDLSEPVGQEEEYDFSEEFSESEEVRFISPNLLQPHTAMAGMPLRDNGDIIGIILVGRQTQLTVHEFNLLRALGNIAAGSIQRALLFERINNQVEKLSGLRKIDLAIATSLDLRVTLSVVLEEVISQLKVDAAAVLLLNAAKKLEYSAGVGFVTREIETTQLNLGEGMAGQAALERKPLIKHFTDADAYSGSRLTFVQNEGFAFYSAVPMPVQGNVIGVLELFHRTALEPDRDWLEFQDLLAGQAAIAIHTMTLFNGLQKAKTDLEVAYDATLRGWVQALDLRDHETEGHTQRVTELTLRLAHRFELRSQELAHIARGALLHDIGKIAIPDEILYKPGPLDEDEWEIMHKHPVYARELLSPIDYLANAIEIPYAHHEKWDGTGYPLGLQGKEIPFSARLFAIVDVWDALTSKRPYREAWSREQALTYIKEQSGKHFDPAVAKEFLIMITSDSF